MICSHRTKQVSNGARWSPAQSHLAGLADRMKLLGLWCFSHRMRVAISPGLKFLWTVVLRKSESCLSVRWEPQLSGWHHTPAQGRGESDHETLTVGGNRSSGQDDLEPGSCQRRYFRSRCAHPKPFGAAEQTDQPGHLAPR